MNSASGLVQAVADNFDANISSANGLRSTHALALLITQVQSRAHLDVSLSDERPSIKRVKKEDMKEHLEPAAAIYRYNGPKKPMMLVQHSTKYVLPLTILASQQVTVARARDVDFTFFQMIVGDHNTPEYGGFNTRLSREQGQSVRAATKAVYTPLIDMTPSDPDTMTAMMEAARLTNDTGQSFTIFTADQQLYRVIVDITWVYPDLFTQFIPRLGGMHLLMSFVGSVGTLMANTGLEEIMKSAFGRVAKMLTGKKFPQNCRALRMITEELLRDMLEHIDCHTDLMALLEERASRSRTVKLWLDNLVIPTFIIMLFIRAEREADWPLHLWSVKQMIPYFFAAGHINYARYKYILYMLHIHRYKYI